jgi:multiple sugar transport system substrate-binding protein
MATAIVGFAASCSSGAVTKNSPADDSKTNTNAPTASPAKLEEMPTEPIKLQIFQQGAGISDLEFETLMKKPVETKFPNITLELVRSGKGTEPATLLTTNSFPDIIYASSLGVYNLLDMNLAVDLNEMIKKYALDINKYDPRAISIIKMLADKGQLYALPFSMSYEFLLYNKQIFDRLSMPYPTDRMEFDKLVDLAKRIGKASEGNYASLRLTEIWRTAASLSLPHIDGKAQRAAINNDAWKRLMELYADHSRIPGNEKTSNFFTDQKLAMMWGSVGNLGNAEQFHKQGVQSDFWDILGAPIQPAGFPSKGGLSDVRLLMVSSTSTKKDIAFKVINQINGELSQEMIARRAQLPGIKMNNLKEVFGTEFGVLKNKNIKVIFDNIYSDSSWQTRYDVENRQYLISAMDKMIKNDVDANTVLREAEEQINKKIDEMNKK